MCSTRLVGGPDGAALAGAARSGYAARRAEVAELADAEDSKSSARKIRARPAPAVVPPALAVDRRGQGSEPASP